MNINNQPYSNYQSQSTVTPSTVERPAAGNRADLNKAQRVGENNRQAEPELAQEKQSKKASLSASEYELVAQAHQHNQTIYDKPQGSQRLAISSYQEVLHAPKREEIQRLVGIDTFA